MSAPPAQRSNAQINPQATKKPGDDSANASPDLIAPSLGRRMLCWLYDGMLLFAVLFVAGWLFSTLGQMRDAMDARRPLLQAFMFIVFGIYFVYLWSHGQTLAMKTWNIRVVDRQGRRISQPRALLRYFCSWVWFIPPLAALMPFDANGVEIGAVLLAWVAGWALSSRFHPQRQFWHDALAGTRLVTAPGRGGGGTSDRISS